MRFLKKNGKPQFTVALLLGLLLMVASDRPGSTEDLSNSRVLDVNSVAPDPYAFEGIIKIRGVVSGVFPSESLFVLIDRREYEACGVLTCANEFVIVRFSGELPDLEEELVVTGEMVNVENRLIFEAQEIQKKGK